MSRHSDTAWKDFKEGGKNHNHPAEPGIHLAVEITSKVISISYAHSFHITEMCCKMVFSSKVKQSASLKIFTQ